MFGRKKKEKSPPIDNGTIPMDFELRRLLGLGGLSPPNISINSGDSDVPPLPSYC